MKGLSKYIKPYIPFICLTMGIKLLGAVLELWIPSLMEVMLDEKVVSGDEKQIWLFGGLMILCAAGCLAMNILSNRMSAISSGKITRAIRHDLFDKLQHLSARQMDAITVSSAESRLTSDTYNVNQMLARIQRMGIRAPSLLIGGIIMMLTMDPVMALLMVALLPFIVLVVWLVTKRAIPLHTRRQTVLDDVVRVVQENITGIRVIKALSKTDHEKNRFYGAKISQIPATACNAANTYFTAFCGKNCKSFAPTSPPAIVPSAVGMSTFTSYSPPKKYHKNESRDTGKITAIAVACACFSSFPKSRRAGTASIPPPPPKTAFAAPMPTPKPRLFQFNFFTLPPLLARSDELFSDFFHRRQNILCIFWENYNFFFYFALEMLASNRILY